VPGPPVVRQPAAADVAAALPPWADGDVVSARIQLYHMVGTVQYLVPKQVVAWFALGLLAEMTLPWRRVISFGSNELQG
jgi:hypothetical protein